MLPGTLAHPRRWAATAALAAVAPLALLAAPASARDGQGAGGGRGGGWVRVAGVCGRGATSTLRLRARDGEIETRFAVHGGRGLWNVTVVHERVVAWRGTRRPDAVSGWFSIAYRLPDYGGADTVTTRATGPRGAICSATATLPG